MPSHTEECFTSNEFSRLVSNKADRDSQNFLLDLVSPALRPYIELIRLEKPTGIILMFWPFVWSLTMAAFRTGASPEVYSLQLLKCFIAAFIIRCLACTVNDIIDRDMDAGVGRTQNRPLPSGRVSVLCASCFLIVQYVIGIVFFYYAFSGPAFRISLFQLLPLFATYPFLKRFTHWPQAWLGIAMNFGTITAWSLSVGALDMYFIGSLLVGCWCWTMLYDTIYACQDIKDDVKVGVRSTAILFGTWIRPLLIGCGLAFLTMLAISGLINEQGVAYFAISVGGSGCHLLWQYKSVDLGSARSCWKNFKQNGQLGCIIWAGLLIDYLQSLQASV